MRRYAHLPSLDCAAGPYALRCIDDADIEPIRQWRNAQLSVLRQTAPIGPEEQERYFARAIWPQMAAEQPETILVAILRGGERIGYGGLVHCAWDHARAEVSVLFAPAIAADITAYRSALLGFFTLIDEIAFARLSFNRLTLETYAIRRFHIAVVEEAGYLREGRLREHVMVDGSPCDSLLHARLASDYARAGGRITSSATRSIRVPAGGGA